MWGGFSGRGCVGVCRDVWVGREGGKGGVGGGEWVGVSCVGCCSGSASSSSLAVAEGGGRGVGEGAGVEEEGGGEGEGGVCDAVGGVEGGGDGGVFGVVGGEGVCGVEGGWERGEGEGVCGVVGGEGGGEWGVPSVSCRAVPVCCVCGGEGGGGVVSVSVRVCVLPYVWVWSVGPEARFWGAAAFGGQLPENPGVWVGSCPVVSGVVQASSLLSSRGHLSSSPGCSWSSPELLRVVLLLRKKREEKRGRKTSGIPCSSLPFPLPV